MNEDVDWSELLKEPPEPKGWLRVDEREDAINALEHAADVAHSLEKRPLNWKWIIISLHNALQASLVCALSGTAGVGALSKRSRKEMLQWFEETRTNPDAKYPDEWLADPMTLYSRAKQPEYMQEFGGSPLSTTSQQDDDVELLNSLRKGFAHFTPRGWSIELIGLPRIVLNVTSIINILLLAHPASTYRLDPTQMRRVESAIATMKELLPRYEGQ